MPNDETSPTSSLPDPPAPADERRIIDFRPGERIKDAVFAVADQQHKTTSNGKPYLSMRLRDCTGQWKALWFMNSVEDADSLKGARFVRISGTVEPAHSTFCDLKVSSCEPAKVPTDISPFLTPLPGDHLMHRLRFREVARSVKNSSLKALLKEIFHADGELWPRFETAPAAKNMHHAYRGGLLEHSGEVALLCERVASTLPHLDCDLLITAALLHDIGKLEEMESDLTMGEYTTAGRLVGHVVLGTCTVAAAIDKIEEFPVGLKHELMHLILSHHGRPEFGAAKIPMCSEAIVLSLCDMMSARAAQCRENIQEGAVDEFASPRDMFGWESGHVYLGSMRRMLEQAPTDLSED